MSTKLKSLVRYQWVSLLPTLLSTGSLLAILIIFQLYYLILPISLGLLAGGVVDIDNRFSGKIWNSLIIFILFLIAELLVLYTFETFWFMAVVNVCACFVYIMSGAFSKRLKTIGFGGILITCYSIFLLEMAQSYQEGVGSLFWMLFGAVYYTLVSLVVHLVFPNRGIKNHISDLYNVLGDFLILKGNFFDPDDDSLELKLPRADGKTSNDEYTSSQDLYADRMYLPQFQATRNSVIQQFTVTKEALIIRLKAYSKRKVTTDMLRFYVTADNIFKTIDFNIQDYKALKELLTDSDIMFRIQRIFNLYAECAHQFAYNLQDNRTSKLDKRILQSITNLERSIRKQHDLHANQVDALELLLTKIKKIYWLFQNINQQDVTHNELVQPSLVSSPSLHQRINLTLLWQKFTNQITTKSPTFRHALRITIFLTISMLIFNLNVQFSFWFMMAGVLVIQPNYSMTKKRVLARTWGSIWGACIGGVLAFDVETYPVVIASITTISFTLFAFLRSMNYGYATAFLTIGVFSVFRVFGADLTLFIVGERILANATGAGLTLLIIHRVFPEWNYLDIGNVIRSMYEKNKRFMLSVLAILERHPEITSYDLNRRQIIAYNLHLSFQNLVSTIVSEPKIYSLYVTPAAKLMALNDYLYGNLKLISQLVSERYENKHLEEIDSDTIILFKRLAVLYTHLYNFTDEELRQHVDNFIAYANELERDDAADSPAFDVNYYIKERVVGIGVALINYRRELAHIYQVSKLDTKLVEATHGTEKAPENQLLKLIKNKINKTAPEKIITQISSAADTNTMQVSKQTALQQYNVVAEVECLEEYPIKPMATTLDGSESGLTQGEGGQYAQSAQATPSYLATSKQSSGDDNSTQALLDNTQVESTQDMHQSKSHIFAATKAKELANTAIDASVSYGEVELAQISTQEMLEAEFGKQQVRETDDVLSNYIVQSNIELFEKVEQDLQERDTVSELERVRSEVVSQQQVEYELEHTELVQALQLEQQVQLVMNETPIKDSVANSINKA